MNSITQLRLKELFLYDAQSGLFIRSERRGKWAAGKQVGSKNGEGYVTLQIDGSRYYAHRMAWIFVTGKHPHGVIDHIDGNKSNNRFENLRDVSVSTNILNTHKPRKGNTSGYLGVYKCGKKWAACLSGKYLGVRDTPSSAHQLYLYNKSLTTEA